MVVFADSSWQGITTRDESGAPCTRGMRSTPYGQFVMDGPPTTLSGEQPAGGDV